MICWVEKTVIAWTVAITFALAVLVGGHADIFASAGDTLRFYAIFSGIPWAVLRVIDWAAGGPRRRRDRGAWIIREE